MDKEKIILNALEYAKNIFEKEGSGHDFGILKEFIIMQ